MTIFAEFLGKELILDLPGAKQDGLLVDLGMDIAVLYNEQAYVYIPTAHIRHCRLKPKDNGEPTHSPINTPMKNKGTFSYREILKRAKDLFIEIAVLGNATAYGYISEILEDYFVFLSPIYKTMLIPLEHLKWLALLSQQQTYYSLSKQDLKNLPQVGPFATTFQGQLESLVGNFLTLDLNNEPLKNGLLKDVTGRYLQLITAREELVLYSLKHIQVVCY